LRFLKLATFLMLVSAAIPVTAFAAQHEKEGFSGYLDAGIFALSSTDTLMVSGNNEEIDSLDDNSDSFGKAIAAFMFEVKYKKNSLTYHIGTPIQTGKPEFELGITKAFAASSVDVSLVLDPMAKVWKDPYVADRDDTDSHRSGLKITWSEIGGSPHYAYLKITSHDIEDDETGKRFDSLERDGVTNELGVGYKFRLQRRVFTPVVILRHDHREGDAESSKGADLKLIYTKIGKNGVLISAAQLGYDKYDEKNPIFGKTRQDTKFTAFASYKWLSPFGWENKHFAFALGVTDRFSNIDFYDAMTYFGGATFGIDF